MRNSFGTIIIFIISFSLQAQVQKKLELGGWLYGRYTDVNYNRLFLKEDYEPTSNGVGTTFVTGYRMQQLFLGVGVGYYQYAKTQGLALSTEIEWLPLKGKISPLLLLRVGYSVFWNQQREQTLYDFYETGIGVQYHTVFSDLYLRVGVLNIQKIDYYGITFGARK